MTGPLKWEREWKRSHVSETWSQTGFTWKGKEFSRRLPRSQGEEEEMYESTYPMYGGTMLGSVLSRGLHLLRGDLRAILSIQCPHAPIPGGLWDPLVVAPSPFSVETHDQTFLHCAPFRPCTPSFTPIYCEHFIHTLSHRKGRTTCDFSLHPYSPPRAHAGLCTLHVK